MALGVCYHHLWINLRFFLGCSWGISTNEVATWPLSRHLLSLCSECSKFSEVMTSKFITSVSLAFLAINDSASTDFGLSSNYLEFNFGFDTGFVSNFDEMVDITPLILAVGGSGETSFSGQFGKTVPGDLNKQLALVGAVSFLGGTRGAGGINNFCSGSIFSSFSLDFVGKNFSAAVKLWSWIFGWRRWFLWFRKVLIQVTDVNGKIV